MGFIQRHRGALVAAAAFVSLAACGKKPHHSSGGRPVGKVEAAFLQASATTGIPARYMMAAGYLESKLVPDNATSNYISLDNSAESVARGTIMTQTAFGLSYEELGLDATKTSSTVLEVQIEAYGRWLSSKLKADGLTLAANPTTPDDKFRWIENMALLHRQGVEQRRAVQVMFARELVGILNAGFTWQDPRGDETLHLEKETPPINIDAADFPQAGKNWFKLTYSSGIDLRDVPYFRLATLPNGTATNVPRRVEVIHCPLSLSACLELQTRSQDGDAELGSYVYLSAHYAIPADADLYDRRPIIQVASHNQAVTLTDSRGENVKVQDAVVIMLTGNSGRTVGGTRQPAEPTWFSSAQLQAMAGLVNDVCTLLSTQDTDPVNREECMKTEGWDPLESTCRHASLSIL